MANELKHTSVGSAMTQSEFEGVGLHVLTRKLQAILYMPHRVHNYQD